MLASATATNVHLVGKRVVMCKIEMSEGCCLPKVSEP